MKQTQNHSQNSDKIDTMSAIKLPSNLKHSDSQKGREEGRLQALDEVEKMCEQMKVETGYKGCLRDFYGYNKALSNIKKEIAKLRNHSQQTKTVSCERLGVDFTRSDKDKIADSRKGKEKK